jgi:hypothetical protein
MEAQDLVEQRLREYSMNNHMAADVSTSMVELGLGDTDKLLSRELRLFVSCKIYTINLL